MTVPNAAPTPDASVVAAAMALCKGVVASPARGDIRTLLRDLDVSTHSDGRPGRGEFGYLARRMRLQIGGYLRVDAARTKPDIPIGFVPSITDGERALLHGAHSAVLAMNAACIAGVATLAGGLAEAVNPYGAVSDPAVPSVALQPTASTLLPPSLVDGVASALSMTALVRAIHETPTAIRNALAPERLQEAVAQMDGSLRGAQTRQQTTEWLGIAVRTPRGRGDRILVEYIAAVTGLRCALRVLDQLVFQAMRVNHVPAVTADNLIALEGPSRSTSEIKYVATVQPTSELLVPEPGDVVFLERSYLPPEGSTLAEIIAVTHRMTQEAGTQIGLTLHAVDKELNTSPLFSSLTRP